MASNKPPRKMAGMNTTNASPSLTPDEIDQFYRMGYVGPFALCSPEEMAGIRTRIEREVLTTDGINPKSRLQGRHADHRLVYDLASHPRVLGRLTDIVGPDLILWATYFFNKQPGGAEIPWHQDANYWPIEPAMNLSIWLAIDEVTVENACVQIIPGSHRKIVPHIPSRQGMAFGEEADPATIDTSKAINMELRPGEFFIFNERLLHHSEPNRSNKRRMGMTGRYTVPFVKILDQEASPLYPGHACMVVSGEDRLKRNRMADPPARIEAIDAAPALS